VAIWIMSNRQPWTEAVINGLISSKTRHAIWIQPGDLVFLHASVALWNSWRYLDWAKHLDVKNMPRGVVYGLAHAAAIGDTFLTMPEADRSKFVVRDYWRERFCGMETTIVFENVVRLPEIKVRGLQQPSKKLPPELVAAIANNPFYRTALSAYGVDCDLIAPNHA